MNHSITCWGDLGPKVPASSVESFISMGTWLTPLINEQTVWLFRVYTLQGINISHLGKRKLIFKTALERDMLVPRRVYGMISYPVLLKVRGFFSWLNIAKKHQYGWTWSISRWRFQNCHVQKVLPLLINHDLGGGSAFPIVFDQNNSGSRNNLDWCFQ